MIKKYLTNVSSLYKGTTKISSAYKGDQLVYSSGLPSEYQEVNYIESYGTEYIDSGTPLGFDYGFDVKFYNKNRVASSNHGAIFGCDIGGTTQNYTLTSWMGKLRWSAWDSGSTQMKQYVVQTCSIHNGIFTDCDGNERELTRASADCPYNAYLFGNNGKGKFGSGGSGCRIYYLKFYYQDELIKDFVPCYRKSDGEVGMYERISKTFLTNQGTGQFTAGIPVEYQEVEYIRGTGSQWLRTTITPRTTQSYYIKVASFSSGNNVLFGSRTSGNYQTSTNQTFCNINSNKTTIALGTQQTSLGSAVLGRTYEYSFNHTDYSSDCDDTGTRVFYVFALDSAGRAMSISNIKMFAFTIKDNGVTVINLIPCYHKSTGEVGMYDVATKTFLTNQGDGEFQKGNDV